MLQMRNKTPFVSKIFAFPDEHGTDTLYATVKATFDVRNGTLVVSQNQQQVTIADEYWGEPGKASLKRSSEAHLLKPGTDVLLLGEAQTPRGRLAESCLVSVQVGSLRQTLKVFGDREWKGGWISPGISVPEPFTCMPLVWERAFGGIHEVEEGEILAEPRNPVGKGFRGRRTGSGMRGLMLPNLEDPQHLIGSISDMPSPVGVGPIAPAWEPRKNYSGTYDEEWQARRAPYLPVDFKPEFFCVAPSSLHSREELKGGELVELLNVSPEGEQRFALPQCEWKVTVQIAGQPEQPPMRLETVLLEPSMSQVCLTWRGAVQCGKRVLKVEEVRFELKALKGVEG
ncbi:DUF2169 family type VI secretion system accessory protein [Hyalangium versicolor]|uniref:DUF2169 family type VI secretion system accessory protein n=1 Tax=Hyalangium versicolor TaxID=2861190 RepID=UPI001CCE167B|nr:DUF2169 domain-containing protein [Hyalangium versicolor]